MAVTLIQPTETIEVKQLCCLIFGQPGSRKSSLAQTVETPITLAFDPGIYRAYGRKTAAMFDTWEDVIQFDLSKYATPVVDTVGRCLSKLAAAIVAETPKNGNRLGGLTLQGYGVLKERFKAWVDSCKERGQNLVFIAQEKEDHVGEDSYFRPDLVGGSYNTLMENCDLVGYMHFENGKRVLDFTPTDRWMAKAPPCGWPQFILPDFDKEPDFLAKLLSEAKAAMGRISGNSAALAKIVDDWKARMESDPSLEQFNKWLPEMAALKNGLKAQIWHLMADHAPKAGWEFDKKAKLFVKPEEVPA